MNSFSSNNCNCANGFQSNTPKSEALCVSNDATYASVYGASKSNLK